MSTISSYEALVVALKHAHYPVGHEDGMARLPAGALGDANPGVAEAATAALERLLEDPDDWPLWRVAATLLARRGNARGARVLFERLLSDALVDEYVERGPAGIRTMCREACSSDAARAVVARRLAQLQQKTRATVYPLAADPSEGDDHVAVRVLGYWDEPAAVELLMGIAQDPARRREVRDEALEALCRLEAPEAIEMLGRALRDPEVAAPTRCKCADALGEIGNYGALDALDAAAMSDPQGELAKHAREAIANILGGVP